MPEQEQHRIGERRLDGLDRPEQDHAQLRDDLLVAQPARRVVGDRARDRVAGSRPRALDLLQEDRVELGARGIGTSLRLGIAVVDHGARERLVELLHARHVVEREAEHIARDADRERRGELLDQLARSARGELAEQRVDALPHGFGEALAHRPHAERLLERPPLPLVVVAVDRQHHHAQRSAHEIRLGPHGELVAAAEQLARKCMRGDEPAAERRHPRDRLRCTQPVERADAAVELEIGELDRASRREARLPRGVLGLVDGDLRDERVHRGDPTGAPRRRGR